MLTFQHEDLHSATADKSDNMLRRRAQPRHRARRRVRGDAYQVGYGAVSRHLQLHVSGDPSFSMHLQNGVAAERLVGFFAAVH